MSTKYHCDKCDEIMPLNGNDLWLEHELIIGKKRIKFKLYLEDDDHNFHYCNSCLWTAVQTKAKLRLNLPKEARE